MRPQDDLDAAIQTYYAEDFDEDARIQTRSVGGRLELARMRRLIRTALPARAQVLDVGGATGVHSRWLAEEGHEVTLVDPVPEQVERARAIGTFAAVVGDARGLAVGDASVDAVLLLGPLYHLIHRQDRIRALGEAHRVLRPGGVVFAQGIGRLSAFTDAATSQGFERLGQADLHILRTGEWANTAGGFPGGHLHTTTELRCEVEEAGFQDVVVHGVEGPNVGMLELVEDDPELLDLGLRLVERIEVVLAEQGGRRERAPDRLADSSPHLLAVGRR